MFDQTTPNTPYGAAPTMGGYGFNGIPTQQMPKVMNVLSADEIKELQQTNSQFTLTLTNKEVLQAACNHRSADGSSDTLTFDPIDGTATCTICGYKFRPIESDESIDSIREASDRIVDILQTIKIMYTEMPGNCAREYFQIIPLINKIPDLFKFAAKNFAKLEYNAWSYQNHNMSGVAMFQNLSNIGSAFGQPQMNPYAAPQQPVGYPAMGGMMPQQPQMNPFGYAGAQPQYQPMTGGYQYQPTAQPTPVAPTVAAPSIDAKPADTTVTQKVNV